MSLDGRTAVVTGSASGIGRGIADRLAAAGATVVVADVRRDPKQGQHFQTDVTEPTDELVASKHGVESVFVETDVSDEDAVVELIATTMDHFDRLDVLVNNAGIQIPGDTQKLSVTQWYEVLDVNLTGAFMTAKYAMPYLDDAPQGRIVNVSSVNAYSGGGGAPYAASKAALVNLTRELAIEAAETDTTVNTVLPGAVKTPMQDLNDEATLEREADQTLLSRLGDPEDVGNAVRFLCSDEAEWITGAELLVDGGFRAH